MTEKVTIEVPARDALLGHITKLEEALTRRNEQIKALEHRLTAEGESEIIKREREKAYRRGYQQAASNLMEATRKYTEILDNVNRQAFDTYLEGKRIGWEQQYAE